MRKLFLLFFAVILTVECNHTFLGTNVQRPLLQHATVKYESLLFRKRIEYFNYVIPFNPYNAGKFIQGILVYDLTNSSASANVTEGGIGAKFVKLRMKSERSKSLKYDIYIYA